MGMCIVIAGNVVDGFEFYGPFKYADEANHWADLNLRGEDWVVGKLRAAQEDGE